MILGGLRWYSQSRDYRIWLTNSLVGDKMKAAVFHGPGNIRVEEVSKPSLEDGDILIKIRACGICGSDLHAYKLGLFPELGAPIESGMILGHEYSGDVIEIAG